ncbi:pilus assembly protein TadG-related protein [Sphingomonas limnosediminicola]|uniref:Pilus assembly protein TadG-related protein n=1 Tax=Sphingomonas limnosediminicola TaxID=940133 RepID=A0ABP7KZY6_9SPHN
MIAFFGKLWRNNRGNTLAIAAAAMPLFIGAAGLATDTIQWTLWKRQLQRAADSAAIAGVYNREDASGATTTTKAAVDHDLGLNLHSFYALKSSATDYPDCSNKCKVEFPTDTTYSYNAVKVTIAIQQPLTFSSFFMSTAPTITAVSTAAAIAAGGDACVEALETNSGKTGITNNGNTDIYMPDCVMFSNSPSANSASAGGSSKVNALAVAAVGGIAQSKNWTVGSYRPYSPKLPDPFAKVNPDPADMNCTTDALDDGMTAAKFKSYAAGTNCFSSLSVRSNKSLNLDSVIGAGTKTIYINGGGVDFQGDFTCTSCTIVMTNKDPSQTATIGGMDANAKANINVTAPDKNCGCTFKGIAFYQDRRATDSATNKINGGSGSAIIGAVYFPSQELWYNGNGTTAAICTMIVSRRVTFIGNSTVSNKFKKLSDCADVGLPSSSTIRYVRLVG